MSYITKKDSFLAKYTPIIEPGRFRLVVRSVSKEPVFNTNINQFEHIVNFYACVPGRMSQEALDYINSNDSIDVANEVFKGQFLTFNQRVNGYIPTQGETVIVEIGFRFSKTQEKQVLVATSIAQVPVTDINPAVGWTTALRAPVSAPAAKVQAPAMPILAEVGDGVGF